MARGPWTVWSRYTRSTNIARAACVPRGCAKAPGSSECSSGPPLVRTRSTHPASHPPTWWHSSRRYEGGSLPGRCGPCGRHCGRSSGFLCFQGFCGDELEAALPAIAPWRLATLPRALTNQQVEQVLASFNDSTPCSQRDHAIVQCLSTLCLRPGEVADLCLDDIDWRGGTLQIRTRKNRRGAVLPLPRVAGQALVDYLRRERPATGERRVFSNSTCSTAVHCWSCSCLPRHRVPRARRWCCGAENVGQQCSQNRPAGLPGRQLILRLRPPQVFRAGPVQPRLGCHRHAAVHAAMTLQAEPALQAVYGQGSADDGDSGPS